jgi:DNA-binding transcriptional LysR family regulator
MDGIERIERRLKLHDVRVLMSVVQAGSMHKAAERLAISQPAVSRAISDLEHALGVRLLDRSPTGIEPTQYGRAIIKRGFAVFDELRQGVKDIEFLADPTAGELRIGTTASLADGLVLDVVDQLTQRHPRIAIDVVAYGPSSKLCRDLIERNVELLISRITESMVEEHGEHILTETLFNDPFVVVAGSQNPWTRRRKIELAELVNEPWTLQPFDGPVGAMTAEAFRASGLKPPRATVTTLSLSMRTRLAATGRFLTVLPNYALMSPYKHPSLRALPVELPQPCTTVAIVTLKNRTLSPLAELFIKTARAVAKPLAKVR